ncbi:MAG TPA: D-glucuronyl C5-epimerase family protein [Gemmatimonadales bacterium]|nr:D-glucuronyl C5-epimerase family protein [Gemmatimonadales bacterium]
MFARAARTRDSLSAQSGPTDFGNAAYLTRALAIIGEFYSRGLLDDSARFHRMTDHVSVTLEQVDGTLPYVNGHGFPITTPYLAWKLYTNVGVFFQPVETSQLVEFVLPRQSAPTDSVVQISEHLYRYALWRTHRGQRYPVWEYEFPWSSGGVSVTAPWLSGMAQSTILMVFADSYRRTGDNEWRQRAFEVFRSLYVPWDEGGVLLPDTLHGYWWEEYHPIVQVWNGAAQALLGVGYFYSVTNDPEVKRVYDRGIEAMKYYTPLFDTGQWTLYSRTQGLNTVYYHNVCIQLMDALYSQSGDAWFKQVADRWRSYTPPPGIP